MYLKNSRIIIKNDLLFKLVSLTKQPLKLKILAFQN